MMKKILMSLILLLSVLFIFCSCSNANAENDKGNENGEIGDSVKMTATVLNISDKIEVDVIEGEYGASGIYLVITSDETAFADSNGAPIARSDIEVGDTVEIQYGGQVMMSYPPQISAKSIKVCE